MANKHMKTKFSNALALQDNANEITPIRMVKIKTTYQMLVRKIKRNSHALLGGVWFDTTTLENSFQYLEKMN